MTVTLITNVTAVLPDGVAERATVALEGGVIVGIEADRCYAAGMDGRGAFCIPGLIDTHSDAIEKEITPRPAVELDATFALRSLEAKAAAAGVTTMCHGIGFEDRQEYGGRSLELANRLVEVIAERRASRAGLVDHRILYRVPARSVGGVDAATAALGLGQAPGERPLLSFEDHTPGQGQYRDVEKFKQYLSRAGVPKDETVDSYVARRVAEGEATGPRRDANLALVSEMATSGTVRVLVHDCEEAPDMDAAYEWGASVAEFPLTVGAARAAREHDMPVVMGAPNVLRGGSHSGNVGAEEMVRLGLCTSLASDYLPSALLAAAFLLVDSGAATLSGAIGLVTSGPADVLGLADRGRIEVGAVADLVLLTRDGAWPRVQRVLRAEPAGSEAAGSEAADTGWQDAMLAGAGRAAGAGQPPAEPAPRFVAMAAGEMAGAAW